MDNATAVNKEFAIRELESRNQKYRDSFKEYCTKFFRDELNKEFIWNWHHQMIFDALEELWHSDTQELVIINIHPGSGKTEIISKLYPTWKIGNVSDSWFMDIGYSADLTKDFSGEARSYVESETYKAIFPRVKLQKDQKSKEYWKTSNHCRYYAVGSGGTITGKRADLIMIDDPTNPKDILSKHQLEKTNDWFNQTVKSRRRAKLINGKIRRGKIAIIMQRLHDNDLCGYLMREHEDKFADGTYKVLAIPAIAKIDELHRKNGEAMFPQLFPLSFLNKEKETSKKDRGVNHFSAQYQQDPIDAESSEFKREYFRYYQPEDLVSKQLVTAIGIDTAFSERQTADYRSIMVVSKSTEAEFYVRANIFGRFTPSEFIDHIFDVVEAFPGAAVIIEKAGNDWFIELLKKEMAARGIFFKLIVIPSRGEKEARMRTTLEPLYSNYRIFHRNVDKYGELEDEVLRFPRSAHDDLMDALETAISRFSLMTTEKKSIPYRADIEAMRRKRAKMGM